MQLRLPTLLGSNTPPVIGDAKEPVESVLGNSITLVSLPSQSGSDNVGYHAVARTKTVEFIFR